MFGKKADDKIAKKQAEQEAKDKAAMEKFGVDFDSYTCLLYTSPSPRDTR